MPPDSCSTELPWPETLMAKLVSVFVIGLLLVSQPATAQSTKPFTSEQLASRNVYRRAVDAVIWGAPAVTLDMMRQAYFRDAKASYNDIVWWPKGAGWQNQSLDVDTSVRYLYVFSNTKNDHIFIAEAERLQVYEQI